MPRTKKTSQGIQSTQGKPGKMPMIEGEEGLFPAKAEYGRRSTTPRSAARRSSAKATTPARGRAKSSSRARRPAASATVRKATTKRGTKISAARARVGGARKTRKSSRSK